MRRLALLLLAFAAGAGILFAYLVWSVSPDDVRSAVTGRLQALTGYVVDIRGRTSISLLPTPAFEIRNVVLRPPPGILEGEAASAPSAGGQAADEEPPDVAVIDVLRGSVDVLPLLLGRLEVSDFTLVRPRLTLTEDRRGRPNWTMSRQGEVGANVGERADGAPAIADVRIGSFRIEDGAITYVDRRGGAREEISAINANVDWPRLAARLEASGSLVWNGEVAGLAVEADKPLDFLRRGTTRARLRLQSGVVTASFDGNAHYISDPQLEGRILLSAPSARAVLRWIGSDIGSGPGLGRLDLSGSLNFLPGSIALTDMVLDLDDNEAEGGINIGFGERATAFQGTLAFEALDLGKYRAAPPGDDAAASRPAAFLTKPVDLSALETFAVDLRISAASVAFGDLMLGRTAGTITVRNGTLDIGVGEAMLYGGTAQGTVTARPSPQGARVKSTLKFDKTDIGPLLEALSGGDPIDGDMTARINLSGNGSTVGEIVADLSGDARVSIADGAFEGIDVVALLEMLKAGQVEGWPSTAAETRFRQMNASFVVTGGSAATDDFNMKGPNIDVAADGEIRLISASVAGHGTADLMPAPGRNDTGDIDQLSVPFVIEGPIARPRIYPDPVWLLNRASASAEEIERARDDLKQKSPEQIIDDLLTRGVGRSPGMRPRDGQPTTPQQ
ncbi:AsmA family protein [Microbaculum marinum]|uniref:AsmA-like C-terminal region-containing protein n=1 Tax=Microbaculum marinum TaxID=1764581 RepID=A0AAW9RS36_9HYPH